MPTANHYDLLGVDRTASLEAIRKAYRVLALASHPDHAGESADDRRFAMIAEAYRVLSDEDRRRAYDRTLDDWDPLGELGRRAAGTLIGRRFGRVLQVAAIGQAVAARVASGKPRRTGRSIRYELSVSPEDVAAAPDVEISYLRSVACADCGGRGRIGGATCDRCAASGRVDRKQTVLLAIPAAAKAGTRLRMAGLGEAGVRGGADGDLVIVLRTDPREEGT